MVDAAVEALMAGIDSPTLAILAGVPVRTAEAEVYELLPATCHELGIPFYTPETDAALLAVAGAMACQVLEQRTTATAFTSWAHSTFGHDGPTPTDRLAELDDEYDLRINLQQPSADLDAELTLIAQDLANGFVATIQDRPAHF